MDLGELEAVVAARDAAWRSAGLDWQVVHWPRPSKSAIELQVTRGAGEGNLILWDSGEAEVGYRRSAESEPIFVHHDFASAQDLADCIDDLAEQIGAT
jgi:hypothetical protein